MQTKLNYAFELYDTDENGSLTSTEVRGVIRSMLDMLVKTFPVIRSIPLSKILWFNYVILYFRDQTKRDMKLV